MDVVRMLLDADEDVADGVFFSNSRDTDGPIPVSCDPDSVADCAIAGACVRACVQMQMAAGSRRGADGTDGWCFEEAETEADEHERASPV